MANSKNSILGQLSNYSRILMIVLVIPVVVSLVMMFVFSGRYYQSIDRMNTVAELKPVISEQIP